jgi:hypothetical protein
LSPSSIAAGTGTTNVTLTVVLPQTSASMQPNSDFGRKLAPLSLALLLLPFTGRLRKSRKRLARSLSMLFLLIAGISAMAGLSGCGGYSSGYFGQPQKSYTILVTGTSGSLSHSTPVTLTIE